MSLQAHRLLLTAAELALLSESSAIALPPGFTPQPPSPDALRAAAVGLVERGVVASTADDAAECVPVEAVVANLAALSGPVNVSLEAAVSGRGLRAFYALAGPLGASLLAAGEGGAELSMFPAIELGRELVRVVPKPEELRTAESRLRSALGDTPAPPPGGRLPLDALADFDEVRRIAGSDAAADAVPLSPQERRLAAELSERTIGTLRALVTGRLQDGVGVGQVVWIATDGGWAGLRPDPDDTGRRMVTVEPVEAEELGGWLAPYVAQLLEANL